MDEVTESPLRSGPRALPVEEAMTLPPAAREAIRRITERPRERHEAETPVGGTQPVLVPGVQIQAVQLPEDFEAGLSALESVITSMAGHAETMQSLATTAREQMAALRQRAEQDTVKLSKLTTMVKAITD